MRQVESDKSHSLPQLKQTTNDKERYQVTGWMQITASHRIPSQEMWIILVLRGDQSSLEKAEIIEKVVFSTKSSNKSYEAHT